MISFHETGELLDEIALSLPKAFYQDLNGGIALSPMEKFHPESKNNELYVLGEYNNSSSLGRFIVIYYGSFIKVYGEAPLEVQKMKLREILVHEFTHHLESKAGAKDLELEDLKKINLYKIKAYGQEK